MPPVTKSPGYHELNFLLCGAGWTVLMALLFGAQVAHDGRLSPWEIGEHGCLWLGGLGLLALQRRRCLRRLTEERIRSAASSADLQRWQQAMDAAGDGLWDWKVQTGETFFSTRWKAMLGYDEADIRPDVSEWKERVHPDDLAAAMAAVQRHLAGETPTYRSEHRMRAKDGSYRWILDRGCAVERAPDGQPLRMVGTHSDITNQRELEGRLRASEEQLRTVVESAGAGYFRLDRSGCFVAVNAAWLSMHGYETPEEILGRHFSVTQTEEDLPQARQIVEQLLRGEPVPVGEYSRRRRDGSIGYHSFSCRSVRAAGEVVGLEGFLIDSTELRRARNDFRMVFERILDGFAVHEIICDEQGRPCDYRFLAVNPAFERLTGLAADKVVGRRVREVIPDLDRRWVDVYGRVALTGEPVEFVEYSAEIGRTFQVRAFRPAAGQFACVVADVTEKRRAEAEVRKLARAVEQSPVTVVITDATGAIEFVNPQFTRATGYTFDEVRGQNPRLLKSGVQSESFYRDLWTTIQVGREWRGELCNRRKDGSLFWEEASISPVVDEAGRITHFLSVKEDVTLRRAATERLREQAELIECVRDPVIVVDLESVVRFWNGGATHIYGWTATEAVGRHYHDLVYDEFHPPPPPGVGLAIRERGEWRGELRQCTKTGQTVYCRAMAVLLRQADGSPKSVLLTGNDITEVRRIESQLQRAQRLESVGALASGVAHDLNNVLAPILMGLELLRPLAVSSSDRDVVQMMGDSARRGAEVVRQLLLFSRGAEATEGEIDVARVVKEVVRLMQETFPRSLTIDHDLPGGLWPVRGNATHLYQVLLNLCVNARDAMPAGGRLALRVCNRFVDEARAVLHPGAQPGGHVEIAVIDTGTGIPDSVLDRIFDPFFTTKEQGKGTGLGLSTVLGIVKGFGGFVEVSSQVGVGSTFQVFLPAQGQRSAANEGAALDDEWNGRGETVLIVDDEIAIRRLLERALLQRGFQVLLASDGAEGLALARAQHGKLSAAVVDMMMPGRDGPAVVQALREISPELPIIACSGLEQYQEVILSLGYTGVGFLRKPFTLPEFGSALRTLLLAAAARRGRDP